jgi:3-oxoacyl-[acyl-carrier protein] reductase
MTTLLLKDKVVWITGASRGIGRGIALACAAEGAQTVLVARHCSHLKETAELISGLGGSEPILADYDITNQSAVGAAFSKVYKQVRRLDVLVNNAGIMEDALIGMVTAAQVEKTFDVNVFAALYHMQYAARLMSRNNGGSIINIASIIGRFGNPGQTVYGASKAAVIGATYSASKELAFQQVRVNAIAPGFIETDMVRQLSPDKYNDRINSLRIGRIGTPDDIARSVLYLGSDLSRYVTGQVIGVDGGMIV